MRLKLCLKGIHYDLKGIRYDTTLVYAIQNDRGYWISEDCGRTWDIHVTDLPVTTVYYLLFHPTSPDTMFMLGKIRL